MSDRLPPDYVIDFTGICKGTGLGLSVVHGIVKALGGEITVESELGHGTTFRVFLPTLAEQRQPSITAESVLPVGSLKVLLVDDEDAIVRGGKRMLERQGHRVHALADSATAPTTFQERPQDFDVVVTDQTMPRMTGVELAAELKRIRPTIPIVITTGHSDDVTAETAANLGFSAFVLKPYSCADLVKATLSALQQETGSGVAG